MNDRIFLIVTGDLRPILVELAVKWDDEGMHTCPEESEDIRYLYWEAGGITFVQFRDPIFRSEVHSIIERLKKDRIPFILDSNYEIPFKMLTRHMPAEGKFRGNIVDLLSLDGKLNRLSEVTTHVISREDD